MPAVLLRPYLQSHYNRLIKSANGQRLFHRDLAVFIISVAIMVFVYSAVYAFLGEINYRKGIASLLPGKILSISLLSFFILLLLSNTVSALGFFFFSKDLPLLLTTPISTFRLYLSRLGITLLSSSWVFGLFGLPCLLAYSTALDLPWTFLFLALFVSIPLVIVPACIASILIILVVNLLPLQYLRELFVGAIIVGLLIIALWGESFSVAAINHDAEFVEVINLVAILRDPHPFWLPSRWAAALLGHYLGAPVKYPLFLIGLLITTTLGLVALGYLVFDLLFMRGWTKSHAGKKATASPRLHLFELTGGFSSTYCSQFKALATKEFRMFFRDPTQCFQLILLLMLTFLYLYNFRALRLTPSFTEDVQGWWKTILCLANVLLGGCVAAAICTRFVFPSVSLEGQGYWIVRSAPISIKQLLRAKMIAWLIPVSLILVVLLISGAWAIQVTVPTVIVCGALGIAMSIGIVGLAIGVGAVYSKFDWESPNQVAASFGSLVYMLLALGVIMLTVLFSSILITLSSVPGIISQHNRPDYLLSISCAAFLTFFINFHTAKWALDAGAQALQAREE